MCETCVKHTKGLLGEAIKVVDTEQWCNLNILLASTLVMEGLNDPYVLERFVKIAERLAIAHGLAVRENDREQRRTKQGG